jgi:hypothetical protein
LCGKEVKVLYDGKYFWKISASRAKEVNPLKPKPVQKDTKPRIEMDDDIPSRGAPRGPPCGPPRRDQEPSRDYRPRDYRPKGDFVPRQVAPPSAPCLGMPLAPCLSDFSSMSLEHPEAFIESPANSWNEEEEYQPKTPPTPPVKDTRPLADIDYQEKVPVQVLYEGMATPPKVTKRKKVAVKKAVEVAVAVAEEEK